MEILNEIRKEVRDEVRDEVCVNYNAARLTAHGSRLAAHDRLMAHVPPCFYFSQSLLLAVFPSYRIQPCRKDLPKALPLNPEGILPTPLHL